MLASFFARHGLDYYPAGTTYYCFVCCMVLPNDVQALLHHLDKYAAQHQVVGKVLPIALNPKPMGKEVLVRKTVVLANFAPTNCALDEQLLRTLERVESPIAMLEPPSTAHILDLRCDVFALSKLEVMTKVISHLEKKGTNTTRSERKASGRICMWRMRSKYGDTGWYVHPDPGLYRLSENFARFVCKILKHEYVALFEHLEGILRAEGFQEGDPKIGGGPFSCFTTTKDYNCRPHKDDDNYDYGFILWLWEGAVTEGSEPAFFALPELGVSFVPNHGDVLCFRPSRYLHCTRKLRSTNLLGVAFFQKCSLYRRIG